METELIDVRTLPMRLDDAGEQMKDPAFSSTIERCDGLILVAPEYNHGYPGLLKHALDTNLKEYIHKAVGICGVSAGPFGGARKRLLGSGVICLVEPPRFNSADVLRLDGFCFTKQTL